MVLIGHSLGCVIIQEVESPSIQAHTDLSKCLQALVLAASAQPYRDLGLSVAGIIFLGGPFQGCSAAHKGTWLAQTFQRDTTLLKQLQKDSRPLFDIATDFAACHLGWDAMCFYETQTTRYGPLEIQVGLYFTVQIPLLTERVAR